MRLAIPCSFLTALVLCSVTAVLADPADEREGWKAQVTEAKARALEARQKALAEFVRAKSEPRVPPISADVELARRNSEAVLSDPGLKHGDIVSTVDGIFVFMGRGDGEVRAGDFVPIARPGWR